MIFLGAGFAASANLPTGPQLAAHLHGQTGRPVPAGKPLHEIAQIYEDEFGRATLANSIAGLIGERQRTADRTVFRLLSKIAPPPVDILTTNWDKLLEEEFGRDNVIVIHQPSDMARHLSGKTNLIKLHGDLDNLTGATVTTSDYAQYARKHPQFVELLRTHLRQKTILFIGYAAEDIDFLESYLGVLEELGNNQNPRYSVSPTAEPTKLRRLDALDIRHIKGTAMEFLTALAAEQVAGATPSREPMSWRARPKLADPRNAVVIDRNPFTVFRAEDMSDELWEKRLFQEPNLHNIYEKTVTPGNVIVEGHRGSGKSMLLLSMSDHVQRLLGRDPPYLGLYVKVEKPVFIAADRRDTGKDEWIDYFRGFFNLIVAEEFVRLIADECHRGAVSAASQVELCRSLRKLLPDIKDDITSLVDLADEIESMRVSQGRPPPRPKLAVGGDLLSSIFTRACRYLTPWQKKHLYVLLDEYDHLSEDQQRVLNLMLTPRGPTSTTTGKTKVYYKIAVKSYELTLARVDDRTLEDPADYSHVYLDRVHPNQERLKDEYGDFIRTMANERLKIWNYGIDIETLLPAGDGDFAKDNYAGFENLVNLSSYLPRDFLELCKDIVFYGYPGLLTSPKPEKLGPISPRIQNTVIKIHGYTMLQNLNRIQDERDRPQQPRTRSEDAVRLVESLGKTFRIILKGSQSKEIRTVSEFIIPDDSQISERARIAIRNCLRERVLRAPLTSRPPPNPKNPFELPGTRFELHRLLCAHFGLSLARRWPKRLPARWFDEILEPDDPDAAIKEYTAYFFKHDEFPAPPRKATLGEFQNDPPPSPP